jgi:hypothetical protein
MDPGMPVRLKVKYGNTGLASRRITVPPLSDPVETCYERGWSDGLPVVPPTEERVLEMLDGTTRSPHEIVGRIPPNYAECTVEKIAVNAVMAGCRPEYMPVVLTAVEAALMPAFGLHGVLATTNACTPAVMVNGPIARAIGMNAKGNVFGQGNRANAAIGRTLARSIARSSAARRSTRSASPRTRMIPAGNPTRCRSGIRPMLQPSRYFQATALAKSSITFRASLRICAALLRVASGRYTVPVTSSGCRHSWQSRGNTRSYSTTPVGRKHG